MPNIVVEDYLEACRLVLRSHFAVGSQLAMTAEELATGMSTEMQLNVPESKARECATALLLAGEAERFSEEPVMYVWKTRLAIASHR